MECRALLAADLAITELMASNATTLEDDDGDTPDWIEIHNGGPEAIELAGWTLTDDARDLDQWEFPSRTLDPGQYLLVFASGKDRASGAGELHTNFKLAAEGEYVALVSPAGTVVSAFGADGRYYPPQRADISYGETAVGQQYFTQPTPGAANGPGQDGFVSTTHVSVERGFYAAPFTVEITSSTPAATIRYTTDGSEPTDDHGTVYSGPITISSTSTLRAAAFKEHLIGSPIETHTYVFVADVLQQSLNGEAPPGFPEPLGPSPALDYGMDPDIVYDPEWGPQVSAALTSVPSFSIVTDIDNLFDLRTGIYANPLFHGLEWERPTSVELIYPDGSPGFQIDAGIRIRGGASRNPNNPKHAFRLFFRDEYGDPKLQFPLFGDEGADEFESIDLRTSQNYSWADDDDPRNTFLRDVFSRDAQRDMGQPYTRSRYYHLYINGHYWGLFQTQERSEASFAVSYFGGDKDDYDVVKSTGSAFLYVVEATDGNLDAYHQLYEATLAGFADNADYYRIQGMNPDGSRNPDYERLVDVDNLIDYMIITYYTGDSDGPGSRFTAPKPNNFFGIYNRNHPDGFKWFEHDSEHAMDLGHGTLVKPLVTEHPNFDPADEKYFNPHWLHEVLTENAEYRQRLADRVWRHFSSGGTLSETVALASLSRRAAEIETAMIAESARWGDAQRPEHWNVGPLTWDDWANAVAVLRRWVPGRTDAVLSQLRAVGWFPPVDPPAFSQPAGVAASLSEVALSATDGVIYYTIDGADPRLIGDGVHPHAIEYQPGQDPLILTQSARIQARVLLAGQWSALSEAMFVIDTPRISEINYSPPPPTAAERALTPGLTNDSFEFIELVNTGPGTIDLGGMRFTDGIDFAFADGAITALGPGQYVLVVRNQPAFEARYGTGLPVAGEFARGGLANGGERIVLEDHLGSALESFTYDDASGWPALAAGQGSTLEIVDPGGDHGDPANWRASREYGGSPGRAGTDWPAEILLNEILGRAEEGQPELVELYNAAGHEVDLSGWYLTNDPEDLRQAIIPNGTTIGAGGYRVLDLAQLGLDLNGMQGDDLWLVESDGADQLVRFVDHVAFGASDEGVALGRWPNGDPAGVLLPLAQTSFGAANRTLRNGAVTVSEVHYHPTVERIFAADFAAGTASDFTPILGTWVVEDAWYDVTPGAEASGDTVTSITTSGRLPPDFALSVTMGTRTVAGFQQNAAVVFDYHSPTDFKFVSMHTNGNKWRIGQRDASGWKFLENAEAPLGMELQADTQIDVRVEIRGSAVILRAPGVRVVHDFGTPLAGGQVGLASKNGTARFTQVHIEWIGDPQDLEFLELAGTGTTTVDLGGWRIEDAVALEFAPGTTLAAGATLVVVGFDPADENKVASFRTLLGIDDTVVLAGPYDGQLSDAGGMVRLLKPVQPPLENGGSALVDRVLYEDGLPWPTEADGGGWSLHRLRVASSGSLAGSWRGSVPNPGVVEYVRAGDMNLDGAIDLGDVPGLALAIANAQRYAAIHGVSALAAGDVDGDGDVDFDDIDDFVALLSHTAPVLAERSGGSLVASAERRAGPRRSALRFTAESGSVRRALPVLIRSAAWIHRAGRTGGSAD